MLQQLAADKNKDNDVLKTAIGVVGDLAQGLGVSHAPRLRTPGIVALLAVSSVEGGGRAGTRDVCVRGCWVSGAAVG